MGHTGAMAGLGAWHALRNLYIAGGLDVKRGRQRSGRLGLGPGRTAAWGPIRRGVPGAGGCPTCSRLLEVQVPELQYRVE